jgi:hypothetical protein
VQLHSFDSAGDKPLDYDLESAATEFTIPSLKAYAVIELFR